MRRVLLVLFSLLYVSTLRAAADAETLGFGRFDPYNLYSANSTNATVVKNKFGLVGFAYLTNVSSSVACVKLYDKATTPTCNSDTPVQRWLIPANTNGAGAVPNIGNGLTFRNGIAFCITASCATSDNTAVAAGQVIVNLGYK